jgi:uncharacterized peroxidase-related enzyme
MAFVEEAPGGESSPAVAAMYAAERQLWGYLPNYAALFSHEPSVMTAWRSLAGLIRGNLDRRRFELVTLAAAQARRSSYCSLAHGKFLVDLFHTPEEVAAIAGEVVAGPVDEVDRALVDFARLVATAPSQVRQQDVDRLRELGLDEREVFLVVAAVAARCFFATVLDALGAEPDRQLGELPEAMRRVLTVGRPIAAAEQSAPQR